MIKFLLKMVVYTFLTVWENIIYIDLLNLLGHLEIPHSVLFDDDYGKAEHAGMKPIAERFVLKMIPQTLRFPFW